MTSLPRARPFASATARSLQLLAKRLDGYLLEPYVAYWKLQTRLDKADPNEIRAFLSANAGTPLAERLRSDWLKLLGKNQQWETFDAELPLLVNDDIEITCYALQSRLRLDTQALNEARPLWFVSRHLPESCDPLFSALAGAQMLSADDLWARIRLALEANQVGQARRVAEFLPASEAPNGRLLSSISSNPAGYLAKRNFDFRTRAGRETTMFAVYRLARTSPPQAAGQWSLLENNFNQEERGYVWGLIAYLGAHEARPGRARLVREGRRQPERRAACVEGARCIAHRKLAGSARRDLGDDPQGKRRAELALLEGARAESARTPGRGRRHAQAARRRIQFLRAACHRGARRQGLQPGHGIYPQ